MANSADGPGDDQSREIVPSELLLVHEGLEEDGESWRATLPLAENLLRRVTVFPTCIATRITTDFHLDLTASALRAPHKRHRDRHTRH